MYIAYIYIYTYVYIYICIHICIYKYEILVQSQFLDLAKCGSLAPVAP